MEVRNKCCSWAWLLLGLGSQSTAIVSMVLLTRALKDYDALGQPPQGLPTNLQQHLGYIIFVLIAVGLSLFCYIYIFFSKLLDKECSRQLSWFIYVTVIALQLTVSVVLAAWIINDSITYHYYIELKGFMQSLGATNNSTYQALAQLPATRTWGIVAACVTFVFGFCGGIYIHLDKLEEQRENLIRSYQVKIGLPSTGNHLM